MCVWAAEMLETKLELEEGLEMSLIKPQVRCKEQVADGGRSVSFHQCIYNVWKDGFCKRHHPDTVAARDALRHSRWNAEDKKEQAACRVERAKRAVLRIAERSMRRFDGNDGPAPISKLGRAVKKLRELRKELAKL